ncbi:unnamed protein product [Pleuronectes platessa]|uniref:Uncharacterized protein n=1 Tax=Pleuronectes platessa TaxID=8262 RepID=A0A9N7VM66_PLEPL|nr:unnamed protein product [Pleuronectes platessa]
MSGSHVSREEARKPNLRASPRIRAVRTREDAPASPVHPGSGNAHAPLPPAPQLHAHPAPPTPWLSAPPHTGSSSLINPGCGCRASHTVSTFFCHSRLFSDLPKYSSVYTSSLSSSSSSTSSPVSIPLSFLQLCHLITADTLECWKVQQGDENLLNAPANTGKDRGGNQNREAEWRYREMPSSEDESTLCRASSLPLPPLTPSLAHIQLSLKMTKDAERICPRAHSASFRRRRCQRKLGHYWTPAINEIQRAYAEYLMRCTALDGQHSMTRGLSVHHDLSISLCPFISFSIFICRFYLEAGGCRAEDGGRSRGGIDLVGGVKNKIVRVCVLCVACHRLMLRDVSPCANKTLNSLPTYFRQADSKIMSSRGIETTSIGDEAKTTSQAQRQQGLYMNGLLSKPCEGG